MVGVHTRVVYSLPVLPGWCIASLYYPGGAQRGYISGWCTEGLHTRVVYSPVWYIPGWCIAQCGTYPGGREGYTYPCGREGYTYPGGWEAYIPGYSGYSLFNRGFEAFLLPFLPVIPGYSGKKESQTPSKSLLNPV